MRADVVVPTAKYVEVAVELREVGHLPLVELLFEGAEEAFDPTVLPGAAGVGALVADAELLQAKAEFAGGEDGFVVGTDHLGFAVGMDHFAQAGEQGAGCLNGDACLRLKAGACSRSVGAMARAKAGCVGPTIAAVRLAPTELS